MYSISKSNCFYNILCLQVWVLFPKIPQWVITTVVTYRRLGFNVTRSVGQLVGQSISLVHVQWPLVMLFRVVYTRSWHCVVNPSFFQAVSHDYEMLQSIVHLDIQTQSPRTILKRILLLLCAALNYPHPGPSYSFLLLFIDLLVEICTWCPPPPMFYYHHGDMSALCCEECYYYLLFDHSMYSLLMWNSCFQKNIYYYLLCFSGHVYMRVGSQLHTS